ncbi:hypothetical protein [Paenibacillus silviterrae]|uniref:hypothetical protein n=1 Tax=Paenibacillus silviterrae TaxID=3242194 RepID=UPI002542E182|nr:hypothetical protein [Paenibacillus chinjuensis]
MWSLIGIIAAAAGIALVEGPALWRSKDTREFLCFSLLLLTGLGLSTAETLQWKIPNPLDAVAFVFTPVSDMLERFLQ